MSPTKFTNIFKTIHALIHLVFAFSCLLYGSSVHASGEGGAKSRQIIVGFAQDTLANDWRLSQVKGIEQGLAGHPNIRFIYSDGKGSTAKQIRDIEDMLASGVDILITSPRDSRAMSPVISKAYRQGIPVILLTRKVMTENYTTFIAPDDAAIARDAANFLAAELNNKGNILMLQGVPSASTAIQRTNAFLEALRKHPGVSVVSIKTANYLRSDAIKAVEEALQQGIEFDAIYAQSDSMASGARIALKKANYSLDDTVIVGIDYISEARSAILNGEQRASFTYPTCAGEAVDAVLAIVAGRKIDKHITVPSVRVTRKNATSVKPIF